MRSDVCTPTWFDGCKAARKINAQPAKRAWSNSNLRRRIGLAGLVCLALTGCTAPGQVPWASQSSFAPPIPSERPPLLQEPKDIAAALARGGYVIYLRHGRTQHNQLTMERANRQNGSFDLSKCATQRQLSEAGRAELAVAGGQFRLAGIALDKAFSSRYCRAIDSAAYFVDGAVAVEALSGEGEVGLNPANKGRTIAFLSQRPAPGRNHFMMAHGGIFWEATGYTVQEGHAVVLDPSDLSVIVARIAPLQWGNVALMRP
jgi:hypothetical protein